MVENENLLLRFKNEEQYINDTTIANLMQDMLNNAAGKPLFKVYLETKTMLKMDEAYTCTLKTRIEPYMLKGAHCESVYVTLNIKYPAENEQEKIKVLNIVTKCLGFMTGTFKVHKDKTLQGHEACGKDCELTEYTFCSNFTKQETGTPENINSHYTSTITLKGNMHITAADGGMLGDMVENYIVIKNDDKLVPPDGVYSPENEEFHVVGKTVEGSWQAVVDNPIKAGSFIPATEYNAVSAAKSLILLYRNDYICNLLRDFAQGILADNKNPFINDEGKPELTLKEVYPDKTVVQSYYIYEIKETREAGAYACISIALLKKEV